MVIKEGPTSPIRQATVACGLPGVTRERSSRRCADRRGRAPPGNGVPAELVATVKQLVSVSNGMCQRAMRAEGVKARPRDAHGPGRRVVWCGVHAGARAGSRGWAPRRPGGAEPVAASRARSPAQAGASARSSPHRGGAAAMLSMKGMHAWVLQRCTLSRARA